MLFQEGPAASSKNARAALALRRAEAGAVFAGAFSYRLARIASEVFGSFLSLELVRV